MIDLNNRDDLLKHDQKGMYALTCAFPDQVADALKTVDQINLTPVEQQPSGVVLTGMGGSAAGGSPCANTGHAPKKTTPASQKAAPNVRHIAWFTAALDLPGTGCDRDSRVASGVRGRNRDRGSLEPRHTTTREEQP